MDSSADCASSRCEGAFLSYEPAFAGNAVFLALFAILTPITIALGIKYRSSIFATTVATGLALEMVGYIGRILLYNNPTDRSGFILFLIGTVVGPTLICGAIFLVMPRIVTVYGEEFRSWGPDWYSFLFYAFTLASLVLELSGGIVSTVQDAPNEVGIGIRILLVGLAVQLVALALFVGHAMLFAIAVRTRHHALDAKFAGIYNSWSFKAFLFAFSLATLLLILRTAYRTIVIAEGYYSYMAQSETLLLVLDGLMVLLATLILLVFFPARVLGDSWSHRSTYRFAGWLPSPMQPAPYELPSTRNNTTYNRSKHFTIPYSPRTPRYPVAPRNTLVDSDALW